MARLQLDMLPVGDADAFVIEVQADGKPQIILLDGGKTWEDGDRVLRQLDAYYERRIDHLILSHINLEHAGGLVHVVENVEPDRIGQAWVHDLKQHGVDVEQAVALARQLSRKAKSEAVRATATHLADSVEATQRLISALTERGVSIKEAFADGGSRIGPFEVLGPTVEFFEECVGFFSDVRMMDNLIEEAIAFRRRKTAGMGPAAPDVVLAEAVDDPETERQASLILLLDYEGDRYLFPGDAGRAAFAACADLEKARGLHLLKVPNHGSKHNLTPELLDLFKPELAYISAGGVGINPHPDLVTALKARDAVVYSTSTTGNVWHHRGDVPPRTGFSKHRPM